FMRRRSARLLLLATFPAFGTASLGAQVVVTGVVTDSVARRPLADALVQMAIERGSHVLTTTTNSLGVFRIDSVVPGTYIIGFFHPALDSLGIDLSPKRFVVRQAGEQRVDLAIPSASTIFAQLCKSSTPHDSTG